MRDFGGKSGTGTTFIRVLVSTATFNSTNCFKLIYHPVIDAA
jgi:hypothetical protein